MGRRRTIGELPASFGSINSCRPACDVNRGDRMIIMATSIVALMQADRSYLVRIPRKAVLMLLVRLGLGTIAAHAQDATWGSTPGTGDWGTAANWSPPAAVPTGIATFGASNTTTITFSNDASVGTLQFNAAAPAYSFRISNFSTLTISGVGIVNNSSNSPTFSAPSGSSGSLSFAGGSMAGNATIVEDGNLGTDFFNTSSAGNAAITTNGAHTFFNDASTAGNAAITINNGLTAFFGTSTAGSATITSNTGGTDFFGTSTGGQARFITNFGGFVDMSFLASDAMTAGSIEGAGSYFLGSIAFTVGLNNLSTEVSGTIADGGTAGGTGGALIKVGTGTLTLAGPNTYSGGTSINGGILAVSNDSNLGTGALSFSGGTLEALVAGGGITSSKTITLNAGGGTFLADAGTTSTLSGAINGVGAFTKDGGGTLILTGNSTYFGATTISAGTLQAGSTTALSPNSAFTVNSVLDLDGNSNTVGSLGGSGTVIDGDGTPVTLTAGGNNSSTTFSGTLTDGSSSLGLTKTGAGTMTLTGVNTYTGGTNLNGGTLAVNSDTNLGTGALSFNGGTLEAVVGITSSKAITLNDGGGTFLADGGTTSTLNGAIIGAGAFTKDGFGTLTLTGPNTYNGGTNFNGGVLAVSGDTNLGTGPLSFNGGVLEALVAGGGIVSSKTITLNAGGGTFLADAGTTSTLERSDQRRGCIHQERRRHLNSDRQQYLFRRYDD